MGFSKKKLKKKALADKKVGPKAKQKVRKALQIQHSQKIRESKRQGSAALSERAAAAAGVPTGLGDELDAVDRLFASVGEGGEEDEEEGREDGGEASDGSESSAGGFRDVGDDVEADDLVEEEPDDPVTAARHMEELKAIKEKDPAFYEFLVQEDKSLLDFRELDASDAEGPEEAAEAPDDGAVPKQPGRVLTAERLQRIQETAPTSFMALKAAMNAYHTAVRSIENKDGEQRDTAEAEEAAQDEDDERQGGRKNRRKKPTKQELQRQKRKEKKRERQLLLIEDEAIFSQVLEWSIANLLTVTSKHAGKIKESKDGRWGMQSRKSRVVEPKPEAVAGGMVDPTRYQRWSAVKFIVHIFWQDTLTLLIHVNSAQMQEFVLRNISKPEALSWLWPFPRVRKRLYGRCLELWSTSAAQSVKLLAFLFLRNGGAMSLHRNEKTKTGEPTELERLLRLSVKAYADVSNSFSWRTLSSFRLMENCFVELLQLHGPTSYRSAYNCVRQLALVLRNACIAVPHATVHKGNEKTKAKAKAKAKAKSKMSSKKAKAKTQVELLVAWPFVRAIYLWTRAIGAVEALRPLAYPLSMIAMGAVKSKLTKLSDFPFVFHCLYCMNRLGASIEAFVPISSHILKVLSVTMQTVDKACSKSRHVSFQGGGGHLDKAKAPDIEVLLHLPEGSTTEPMALEAVGSNLCFLLTDHLGLLSQSPAFPELITPVLFHMRRHKKHCKSEPMRRQFKSFIDAAEEAEQDLRARREALTEVPNWKKFLIFEPNSALAKARHSMLQRRAAEERTRVEGELEEANKAKGRGEGDDRKQKKGEKEKEKDKKKRPREGDEEAPKRKAKAVDETPKRPPKVPAHGGAPQVDKVEEMAFSSEED